MHSRCISHFRLQVLIILLVALGLLCAGARVPDTSRPHRPKPSQRVVLESHHKSSPSHLKQCGDVVAIVPKPADCSYSIGYLALPRAAAPRYTSLQFFPRSGRSPPATLS